MVSRQQNIGYLFLCLLLCNSAVSTYASIENNAKTYTTHKFIQKVKDTLVKLSEPQWMQAKANAEVAKKLNLSPPRITPNILSQYKHQHWDTHSFVELQSLTTLDQIIENSIENLRPAHLSNLMSMLELRNKDFSSEMVKRRSDENDGEVNSDKFGTLRIELKHCKVNRDMDRMAGTGTNDMYVAARVGGSKQARSMRKITLIHDNTEEINFEGKVDGVLEFQNVEFEELKTFKLLALDDDAIGYDVIGRSKGQKLDSTDGEFVTKKLYYNKGNEIAGTITYKVDWIQGAVASKGVENKVYRAPWKRWTGFPNFSKNSNYGSKYGTSKERNHARILGIVVGLFAGGSAGMLDLVENLGESLFENIEKNWGPVGKQFEKMQEHMAKAVEKPTFQNLKAALKELLLVGKVLLKFLWTVVTTKEFAAIGLIIGMIGVFIAVLSLLPTNLALMFTVINALFSAWYISDQFVDIYKNLHKCDGGDCLLHHIYKGWGAVGRLIGYCLAEFLYMKSFQTLWKQGKLMLGKINKNAASKINIEKLTKAAGTKKPKALPKPAPKPQAPKPTTAKAVKKVKTASYDPYAYNPPKAGKVESGEEIKKRLAVTMKKYKGRTKADLLTANPLGTGYYANKAAKAPKIETAEEISARLSKTMKKYANKADDVAKSTADDIAKKVDDVAAKQPKKDVYEEAAKMEKKKKAAEKSEETSKRVEQKRKSVMSKGTDYWGAIPKKRTRL